MKRLALPDDVKITAARTVLSRARGTTANGSDYSNRWHITITRGDKSCTFPYMRGNNLTSGHSVDLIAAVKAVMTNMAVLHICPTQAEMSSLELDVNERTYARLVLLRDKLKVVLGDDFDRLVNIVLANAQEVADVA